MLFYDRNSTTYRPELGFLKAFKEFWSFLDFETKNESMWLFFAMLSGATKEAMKSVG